MSDFGSACASVPKTGAGSFTGMADAPVATAASANPVLSTLVTAVKKAGLVDTLNSAKDITVFAPDNCAFAKIPSATLGKVLANKAELTQVLTYHVASGDITPAQFASGGRNAGFASAQEAACSCLRPGGAVRRVPAQGRRAWWWAACSRPWARW
jgi:uncharacterized surface protein with fasciclin (FAS1) repeats